MRSRRLEARGDAVMTAFEEERDQTLAELCERLTVVAVGTSLPELTASTVAAWRGQGDVAFGNVVGSNIYNILGILGVTALVQPVAVPPEIMAFDGWAMLAATMVLVAVTVAGWRVNRAEGAVMLTA